MHYIYFLPKWDLLCGLIFLAKLGGKKTTEKESSEIKEVLHHSFIHHKGFIYFLFYLYHNTDPVRLGFFYVYYLYHKINYIDASVI